MILCCALFTSCVTVGQQYYRACHCHIYSTAGVLQADACVIITEQLVLFLGPSFPTSVVVVV